MFIAAVFLVVTFVVVVAAVIVVDVAFLLIPEALKPGQNQVSDR